MAYQYGALICVVSNRAEDLLPFLGNLENLLVKQEPHSGILKLSLQSNRIDEASQVEQAVNTVAKANRDGVLPLIFLCEELMPLLPSLKIALGRLLVVRFTSYSNIDATSDLVNIYCSLDQNDMERFSVAVFERLVSLREELANSEQLLCERLKNLGYL